MKDLTRWSHSRLRTFDECRRRWWHTYIDESIERPVDIFVNGSAIHNAIREYGAHCWKLHVDSDESEIPGIAAEIEDRDAQNDFHWWARRQIWDWDGFYGKADFELVLQADLPDGKGTFVGHLDFLRLVDAFESTGQRAILTDWKRRPSGTKPSRHPSTQLQQYAWLVCSAIEQVTEVSLQLEFVATGEVWPGPYSYECDWDYGRKQALVFGKQIVAEIERVEANLAEGLEAKHWPPCPGEHCRKACSYMHLCPAAELRQEIVASQDGEALSVDDVDSLRLRELECYHRAQADMLGDAIRARHDGQVPGHSPGPITTADGTVGGRWPKNPTIAVRDWNKLVARLIEGKADLNKVLGSLKRGAGKRLMEDPTGRYGEHLYEKPGGTEWKYKKVEETADDEGGDDHE